MTLSRWLGRFGLDGFMAGLILSVLLGLLVPDLGRSGGLIHLDWFTNYGVALVFLLHGVSLAPDRLKAGLLNWRLHLLTQSATFLLFPLLVWAGLSLAGGRISTDLALGFFYLAAAPSTISSSVAMTGLARGNVAGAIFNASLSSLIAVFATPLLIDSFLSMRGQGLDLLAVITKIVMLVLAPIVVGQMLRPLIGGWVTRHLALVKSLDRATILAIVFNSFADSVAEGIWKQHGLGTLALICGLSLVLFFLVMTLLGGASRMLGLNREDRIALMFCGSKKSMAAGVPMAKVMFGGQAVLGVVIAPILIYHFLQLVAASILARRWGEQSSESGR